MRASIQIVFFVENNHTFKKEERKCTTHRDTTWENETPVEMAKRRQKMDNANYLCTTEFFVVSMVPRPEQTWGMLLCRKCACDLGEDIHVLKDATLIIRHALHSRLYVYQSLRHRRCFLCQGDVLKIQPLGACFTCFSEALMRRKERPRGSLTDGPSRGMVHEETTRRVPEGGIAYLRLLDPTSDGDGECSNK